MPNTEDYGAKSAKLLITFRHKKTSDLMTKAWNYEGIDAVEEVANTIEAINNLWLSLSEMELVSVVATYEYK